MLEVVAGAAAVGAGLIATEHALRNGDQFGEALKGGYQAGRNLVVGAARTASALAIVGMAYAASKADDIVATAKRWWHKVKLVGLLGGSAATGLGTTVDPSTPAADGINAPVIEIPLTPKSPGRDSTPAPKGEPPKDE